GDPRERLMEQPIVVCGLGRVGWRVLEYLQAANLPVVIVDTNCRPDDPRLRGVRVVVGDCRRRDILEAADVAQARGVVILTGDDLLNISATLMVRPLNPDVRVVLRMFNHNLLGRLGKAVRNVYALSTSMLTAPILAMTAMTGQGLGAFRLEHEGDGRRQVAETTVHPESKLYGRTIAEALGDRAVLVLAHLPRQGAAKFLLEVDPQTRLIAGDRLVLCGDPHLLVPLLADSEGAATRDGGRPRPPLGPHRPAPPRRDRPGRRALHAGVRHGLGNEHARAALRQREAHLDRRPAAHP